MLFAKGYTNHKNISKPKIYFGRKPNFKNIKEFYRTSTILNVRLKAKLSEAGASETYNPYIPSMEKTKEFRSLPLEKRKLFWRYNNKLKNLHNKKNKAVEKSHDYICLMTPKGLNYVQIM